MVHIMAKRLFFQSKIYDYTSEKEAERHMKEMRQNRWVAKRQDDGNFVYKNSQDDFWYSVEYLKER